MCLQAGDGQVLVVGPSEQGRKLNSQGKRSINSLYIRSGFNLTLSLSALLLYIRNKTVPNSTFF